MIQTPATLAANGIIRPSSKVWRVRLVFTDGTDRVICVSPGRMHEAEAIIRAKRHAGIVDDSILDTVEAEKVQRELQATPFGMVQKSTEAR